MNETDKEALKAALQTLAIFILFCAAIWIVSLLDIQLS